MRTITILCALALAACGGTSEGGGPGGSSDGSGASNPNAPCSTRNACPAGQWCFNGLCVPGCNTNQECAADQYCDTNMKQCANKVVPTCQADDECNKVQVCTRNVCTAKIVEEQPATQCSPDSVANDGCDKNAFCIDEDGEGAEKPYCYSMPACGENGACPVGQFGAVCNDGLIPEKGRVCLIGACKAAGDCPSSWNCVKFPANAVLGVCQSGAMGSLCTSNAECLSPTTCLVAMPGMPGICMTGMPDFPGMP